MQNNTKRIENLENEIKALELNPTSTKNAHNSPNVPVPPNIPKVGELVQKNFTDINVSKIKY